MMPQEESDDDYLDDPIRLISNPETGADVVETRVVQIGKEHIKLPVTFFDFPRNIRLLNQCLSMSIKLVDCDKHPWYYKNKVKTPTETIVIDDDSITDCIIIEDKNENMDCKYQSVNNVNISEANKKPKIRPVATPYQNLFDNSKKNALKEKFIITENNWKAKVIKNHSSQDKGVQIDFKRNEGLVGLRLQYTNIGVLKTAKDRTEKEIKEPKNCNPDKHKSSNDTPKSLVELNSKISYTSNIQVSKNSLDKTLNTKSSLPKEAIKVTDGCELNKKESNCIRTDLKSLQGMKILSSDENLKLATKTHISNATKYTKGKKESDKSKCDKLNNNYKHNKNVNKKDSKRSASEITKLSKKKDKKHVNKKHNGFDKVLFKQQQGNLKTCTDKSDATIHVTTIACRDQITNEHNCVVQKDNAKKLFSHKEHDTFSKQSTKPIVAYNQTTNERNCEAQKDNSKSTDATYNQTTHEHNCGAQKDEQKSVVQKVITKKSSGHEGHDIYSKQSTKSTSSIAKKATAKKSDNLSLPSANLSSFQSNSSMYSQMPHLTTTFIPNKNSAPTVENTQLNSFNGEKNQTPTGPSSLQKLLASNTSAVPNQEGNLYLHSSLVQSSAGKQFTDKTPLEAMNRLSQSVCASVSMSTASTSSQVSYRQNVPGTTYTPVPASYNTSKHKILVARNYFGSRNVSNEMVPHTNLGNVYYQDKYKNIQKSNETNQNFKTVSDNVSGIARMHNVPLNTLYSNPQQIMEGASNSVEPNITISVKPTSSADISSTANNLNVGNDNLTNEPLPPKSDYIKNVVDSVFNLNADNYLNPSVLPNVPNASNYPSQRFPISTYITDVFNRPKTAVSNPNLRQINTNEKVQPHLSLDGTRYRKHIKCSPIYDNMPQNIPQNVNSSNINNMIWNNFYVPMTSGRPPYVLPPPPPPPPPPPLNPHPHYQSAQLPSTSSTKTIFDPSCSNSIAGTTIIGQNVSGPVRKINITASKDPNFSISGQEKSVNTKEKMIEELSKVAFLYSPPQGPVKDLKKSLLETDLHPPASNASNDVKRSKPAPTSKKPNLGLHSSMPQCKPQTLLVPQNGYSPPILPIPTYQRSLEILAKANMAEARMPVNYDEKVTSNIVPRQSEKVTKRKLSLEDCKVDKVKKISLDEYKKRASKHDQQREEEETLEDDVAKKRIRSESTDQDLGYDSDSTVKL